MNCTVDIVERLRHSQTAYGWINRQNEEAAKEIERLRAAGKKSLHDVEADYRYLAGLDIGHIPGLRHWLHERANKISAIIDDGSGWIEWPGGDCPVDRDALVDVKHRDGTRDHGPAGQWSCCWENDMMPEDIIAYRLHPAERRDHAKG